MTRSMNVESTRPHDRHAGHACQRAERWARRRATGQLTETLISRTASYVGLEITAVDRASDAEGHPSSARQSPTGGPSCEPRGFDFVGSLKVANRQMVAMIAVLTLCSSWS